MTAAAAKKKRVTEPDKTQEGMKAGPGLWIDESLLPTSLAKRSSSKEATVEFPFVSAESKPRDRILRLADILLGNPKGTPIIERRMKQKKFKGVERRSTG